MPTFNDSENLVPFVPEGDYVFCVTEVDQAISAGGKTAGATKYELTLEIDPAKLIAALRAERGGGPAVVGCYHSHPRGGPPRYPRGPAYRLRRTSADTTRARASHHEFRSRG